MNNTNQVNCIWFDKEVCEKGILKKCNHCGKVLCTYHFDTMAHTVYGCECISCGKTVVRGCNHGIPDWSESKVV